MDNFPWLRACFTSDDVPARVCVGINRVAGGADQLGFEPVFAEARIKVVADRAIARPRRVKRGKADQILEERDQLFAFGVDAV